MLISAKELLEIKYETINTHLLFIDNKIKRAHNKFLSLCYISEVPYCYWNRPNQVNNEVITRLKDLRYKVTLDPNIDALIIEW